MFRKLIPRLISRYIHNTKAKHNKSINNERVWFETSLE